MRVVDKVYRASIDVLRVVRKVFRSEMEPWWFVARVGYDEEDGTMPNV